MGEGKPVTIDALELLALKKLAVICGALTGMLTDPHAAREQRALTSVLVEVINRASTPPASRG